MRVHAKDVIYFPDRLFENSNTGNQEGGNFFLQDICSHVVLPNKHTNPTTGDVWYTLETVSLSTLNLNDASVVCNDEYVGQMDLDARKVGELHRRYRCRFNPSEHPITPKELDFSKVNALDVISELYDTTDIVNGKPIKVTRLWAVVSLKHQLCAPQALFVAIASSSSSIGYSLDGIDDPDYLARVVADRKLQYFKDFDVNASRVVGKFHPVWRVKLMI